MTPGTYDRLKAMPIPARLPRGLREYRARIRYGINLHAETRAFSKTVLSAVTTDHSPATQNPRAGAAALLDQTMREWFERGGQRSPTQEPAAVAHP